MRVQSMSLEDSLDESMATHSRILAWRIPWKEEPPGGLPSIGWQSQTRLKQLSVQDLEGTSASQGTPKITDKTLRHQEVSCNRGSAQILEGAAQPSP